MVNIKDVAKVAGVSVTTVSRVINNRGYISKETRQKVEDAMVEIDYHPNQIARALQGNQSYLIGVIVPDSNHPFFSELIKCIEQYASNKNYKILICNSLGNSEKELNYIHMLRENRVDGIIMCSHTLDIDEYKKVKLPIITFDRIISQNIPYVASDNYRGGELATKHLIDSGCRNLLHISGDLSVELLPNRRCDAFQITCLNNNIPYKIIECSLDKWTFDYYSSFIDKEVSKYLPEFDGVFCSNDSVAYALYIYAIKHGLKVPEDLKIVGYDYHSFTRMLQIPKLTTIYQPVERIGNMLSSNIINIIEGVGSEFINNTTVDVELIKGETT